MFNENSDGKTTDGFYYFTTGSALKWFRFEDDVKPPKNFNLPFVQDLDVVLSSVSIDVMLCSEGKKKQKKEKKRKKNRLIVDVCCMINNCMFELLILYDFTFCSM